MKKRRKRERLADPPRQKRRRERLVMCEPASATFTALMQEIGSNSASRRRRAAHRLAAHCAVLFRES